MTYVFQYSENVGQQSVCTEVNVTAVCNNNGYWKPNSEEKQCPKINNSGIILSTLAATFSIQVVYTSAC